MDVFILSEHCFDDTVILGVFESHEAAKKHLDYLVPSIIDDYNNTIEYYERKIKLGQNDYLRRIEIITNGIAKGLTEDEKCFSDKVSIYYLHKKNFTVEQWKVKE